MGRGGMGWVYGVWWGWCYWCGFLGRSKLTICNCLKIRSLNFIKRQRNRLSVRSNLYFVLHLHSSKLLFYPPAGYYAKMVKITRHEAPIATYNSIDLVVKNHTEPPRLKKLDYSSKTPNIMGHITIGFIPLRTFQFIF